MNLMELNEIKSNYIIYSRSKLNFNTRLQLNNNPLEKQTVIKLLGVWLTEDLTWDVNVKETCKKAYTRTQMLTKLKFAGIANVELVLIYKLFIRSLTEYCSVVYHTSLTIELKRNLELVQKTCLRIILGNRYTSY